MKRTASVVRASPARRLRPNTAERDATPGYDAAATRVGGRLEAPGLRDTARDRAAGIDRRLREADRHRAAAPRQAEEGRITTRHAREATAVRHVEVADLGAAAIHVPLHRTGLAAARVEDGDVRKILRRTGDVSRERRGPDDGLHDGNGPRSCRSGDGGPAEELPAIESVSFCLGPHGQLLLLQHNRLGGARAPRRSW